jgi:hypothetical protein
MMLNEVRPAWRERKPDRSATARSRFKSLEQVATPPVPMHIQYIHEFTALRDSLPAKVTFDVKH